MFYELSALLIAFISSTLLGPVIIPRLRKLKFGQNIRVDGPKSHLIKQGTPTMGGLIFIMGFLIPILLFRETGLKTIFVIVGVVGLGIVGFLDDYLKVVKKQNEGLDTKQKIIAQLLVAIIIAVFAGGFGTDTYIPFLNVTIDMGILFYPFVVFFIIAVSNAVNLTDGVDGLNTSVTICVTVFFAIAGFKSGDESAFLSMSMIGALLGFLIVNKNPAKVFMGDLGSLALGGFVGSVALVLKMPFVVLLIGIIYIVETLSVIIQVSYFKKTRKRIFKMTPIHHHFEHCGWSENKICIVFSSVTIVMGIISYIVVY